MSRRQCRDKRSSLVGTPSGPSGRVCARVFRRFRDIPAHTIARQVPIARTARTTEDNVWYCLYCLLRGFGDAARA